MKNYEYIAFDLDGTLTNPALGLVNGFVYAFRKLGVDYGDEKLLCRFIGPPLIESWEREYSMTKEEAAQAVATFREYFSVYGWRENELYPGIKELLSELKAKGKKLLVATSKPEVFVHKILRLFGIHEFFDFIGAATLDHSRDSKSQVLSYVMEAAGIKEEEKGRCILVGDTKYDVEGARLCGIDSLGVTYGFGTAEELTAEGATYIAESVAEAGKILLSSD